MARWLLVVVIPPHIFAWPFAGPLRVRLASPHLKQFGQNLRPLMSWPSAFFTVCVCCPQR